MAGSEKKPPNPDVKTIQSVDRALDILECLCFQNSYRLGELAERCHLNKTTAFHILKTLESRGYVEKSYDTSVYKLGWRIFEVFAAIYQSIDIKPIILPYMERIREQTNETVNLNYFAKMENYYASINFIQLESSHSLKYSADIGTHTPIHCTAAGKVRFLGYSQAMLEEQLQYTPFDRYTEHTVTDPEVFRAQLDEIRKQGFCIEKEEYLPGICSVAVPLFKYTGRVIYAVSVSVPTFRASDQRLREIAVGMMDVLSSSTTCPDLLFKGAPIPPCP
ncbi:IclR family transcriptional regulator [Pseudoflavonifractor sp. 60]|uniref:IclR family transcriptional regulator n=1 Tax=Pseudoflavonifractor sp. 60 TaxID=2304576 RepID=UPI0013720547|nr:IclR family transcriptional regulator [Pseudoflavonifractor sp. 60]